MSETKFFFSFFPSTSAVFAVKMICPPRSPRPLATPNKISATLFSLKMCETNPRRDVQSLTSPLSPSSYWAVPLSHNGYHQTYTGVDLTFSKMPALAKHAFILQRNKDIQREMTQKGRNDRQMILKEAQVWLTAEEPGEV